MKLISSSFADGSPIPDEYAFCNEAAEGHVRMGPNRNPALSWFDVPDGTRSFALICHDPDAPSRGDDVNQEGRSVPAALPRVEFIHWVLVDLPPDLRDIAAGSFSSEVTASGKTGQEGPKGVRQGLNDYTGWFASDEAMKGNYFGYDGPCPPWNDEIPHRYIFTLYALDVPRCRVEGVFDAQAVRTAIAGHILAEAKLTGLYSLNPNVSRGLR